MPIHDAFARTTPYELLLPDEEFARDRFPRIRKEAEERGGGVDTPDSFLLLAETALALREIRGEDDGPDLIRQHGSLLYQAFHFWEAGEPLYLLDTDVARFLVETGPEEGGWSPALPGKAGYVQLPLHLVWTPGGDGEASESLDGIFWSAPDGENITLLIVIGMRKDRPGLAVVPLPSLPMSAAVPWASMMVRPEGEDFASSLPGAALEGLYSIEAGGEALKLAMRIFWYLDVFPLRSVECAAEESPEPPGAEEVAGEGMPPAPPVTDAMARGPRPSALPYRRIIMGDA